MSHDAAADGHSNIDRWPLFPIVAGIALSWGLMVPTIFEWSEKPAARSRHPEMQGAAVIVLVIAAASTFIVWRFNRRRPTATVDAPASRRIQFSLKGLMIAIAVTAVSLAVAPMLNPESAAWLVAAALAVMVLRAFRVDSAARWRLAALVAAMFLPFCWLVLYNKPIGYSSGLIQALPFAPALLPAIWIRGPGELGVPAAILVSLELLAGSWLCPRSSKSAVAYLVLVLLLSCFNSLVLHVLYSA